MRLTLRGKLIGGCAAVLLLLVVVGFAACRYVTSLSSEFQHLYAENVEAARTGSFEEF